MAFSRVESLVNKMSVSNVCTCFTEGITSLALSCRDSSSVKMVWSLADSEFTEDECAKTSSEGSLIVYTDVREIEFKILRTNSSQNSSSSGSDAGNDKLAFSNAMSDVDFF